MKRRQAFTLVELMVSMALIIFIMAILSQAFIAGLTVFRNLKGQGDLAEKLRSTTQILQHDLAANHFGSNRRLSDPTFWNNGPPQQGFFQLWQASQSSAVAGSPSFIEGNDLDGIPSYRTTFSPLTNTSNHALAFTVRLVGNDIGDFMSASAAGSGNVWLPPPTNTPVVPQLPGGLGIGAIGSSISPFPSFGPPESRYQPNTPASSVTGYNSQWAAVAWFLSPQMNPSTGVQDTTVPDPTAVTPAVPLYTLYRRQCLLVPDNNLVTLATVPQTIALGQPMGVLSGLIGNFLEMSCLPDPNKGSTVINFNSPRDITMPAYRATGWGGQPIYTPIPQGSILTGSDIQLNDVVSFDVRILPMYPGIPPATPLNPADPFVSLFDLMQPPLSTKFNFQYTAPPGVSGYVFDTWSDMSNGINDYSQWSNLTTPTPGLTIPFWTTNSLTYQYPVGTTRQLTLPGATTMFQAMGTSASKQATGSGPIIRAIQITIRIWDFKTNQTRQVTIVQAM